ncbi:MAG: 2-(1,2-epoxy,2-dihydrophenyl)acetyl-CoA isomerase [Frankiales bacterium]|jgi:2-(1,2-epoxy-1,2-dihydrophenyl)acetyl-CoA isomerase|nr:2-(1,2-epoxy,2-dihydrophenyl)acetyl-CoA isomerase [Frankiales bacterium]
MDDTRAHGTEVPGPRQLHAVTGGHHAPPVHYTCTDGIGVATLTSPQTRNALSPEVLEALDAACAVAVEEGAKVLVLTGAGRAFCAGGDLAGVNDALNGDAEAEIRVMVDRLHSVITMLRELPMPTVAAVNGLAVGAGVSLALAADVRVMAKSASFVTGYLAVGASPDGGASYHLARALGGPQALSSFLLNKRFTADDLLARGLVDAVVEDSELLSSASEVARGLGALSFPTVKAVRALVDAAAGNTLQAHLDEERAHFLSIAQTPQFSDAMAPFARRASAPA